VILSPRRADEGGKGKKEGRKWIISFGFFLISFHHEPATRLKKGENKKRKEGGKRGGRSRGAPVIV